MVLLKCVKRIWVVDDFGVKRRVLVWDKPV